MCVLHMDIHVPELPLGLNAFTPLNDPPRRESPSARSSTIKWLTGIGCRYTYIHVQSCKWISLAGQTLHARRKGLVSCLYASCFAAVRSAAPIRVLHVILKYIMVTRSHMLTNQMVDLHKLHKIHKASHNHYICIT